PSGVGAIWTTSAIGERNGHARGCPDVPERKSAKVPARRSEVCYAVPVRAVVQRVSEASVTVEGAVTGAVSQGLCVLLGVGQGDSEEDARWIADKVVDLRIFEDEAGEDEPLGAGRGRRRSRNLTVHALR